jgi:hypothetical protein
LFPLADARGRRGQRAQGSGRGEHDHGQAAFGVFTGQHRPAVDVAGVPVRRVQHEHPDALATRRQRRQQARAHLGGEVLETHVRERRGVVLAEPARDGVLARWPVGQRQLLADDDPHRQGVVRLADPGGVDDGDEVAQLGGARGAHGVVEGDGPGGGLDPPGQRQPERGDADAGLAVDDRESAVFDGQRGGG